MFLHSVAARSFQIPRDVALWTRYSPLHMIYVALYFSFFFQVEMFVFDVFRLFPDKQNANSKFLNQKETEESSLRSKRKIGVRGGRGDVGGRGCRGRRQLKMNNKNKGRLPPLSISPVPHFLNCFLFSSLVDPTPLLFCAC